MKILLIQHKDFINGSGGTEKMCSFLANCFVASQHQVEIATNENISGKPVFSLDETIKITNIFDSSVIQKNPIPYFDYIGKNPVQWIKFKFIKKYSKLRNKLFYKKNGGINGVLNYNLRQRSKAWKMYIDTARPDLIITMSIGSLLEISYKNHYEIPILNSVNGRPDYDYSDILWHRDPLEIKLLKESYESLSGIQILFENYIKFLPETFGGKVQVIPNPVPQISENEMVKHDLKKDIYKIVNIASLATDCKQQHIAIDCFASLSNKYPKWELHFWGVGNDFDFLSHKIRQLNLQNKVFLNGFTNDPLSKLKDSDIFIFPSKYEGFGLALTEAMAAGLPSIGFESCSGVNELIEHGKNGFLAKDEIEMVNFLEKLIQDNELRKEIGQNAHHSVKKYAPQIIINQWNDFINAQK